MSTVTERTAGPGPAPTSTYDHHDSIGLRIQHVLHGNPVLGPLAVLVVAIIAFSIFNARFFSAANLSLVLAQVTVIAVLALGQTLIILTAGIDLSVGAIAVFSSILMATFCTDMGMPGLLALLLGFACGTAMGALQRLPGHPAQAATVHRHARHADHLLLAERGGVQAARRCAARTCRR